MARNIQAIRGMNDILPAEISYWHKMEAVLREVLAGYGYQEIRFPIVESTALFTRSIGEVTDIVEKEMYTFSDRNDESLTLRPEGTAGCVRAGIEHGLLHNQIQRFWYQGAMFRHERPQKGRYRQFHQCGVEAFGLAGPDIDAELIMLAARLWQRLGISDKLTLELNTLGTSESRMRYRDALVTYLEKQIRYLDEDAKRRLYKNPLRILDSKNTNMAEVLQNAPQMMDYLDEVSSRHFARLCRFLDLAGIKYVLNPRLVRGLDYYCLTVFEWTTTELGSQGAVCAGGHYDGLTAELGGRHTAAIGFAIGLERLVALVKAVGVCQEMPAAYFVAVGILAQEKVFLIAEKLRSALPTLKLIVNCDAHKDLAQQLKRADKSGAKYALICGDAEISRNVIAVKSLREITSQREVKLDELIEIFRNSL